MQIELQDIQTYLQCRPNTQDFLAQGEDQQNKYVKFSQIVLKTFYVIDQIEQEQDLIQVIAEEALFLYLNNVDLNPYYEYNALQSFNVAGIQGAVRKDSGNFVSEFVRKLMNAIGIERIQADDSQDIFTSYSRV